MPRRLTDSNVDPNLLSKLEDAGYETIEDIDDTGLIQVIQGEDCGSRLTKCNRFALHCPYGFSELALTEPETTELLRLVQGGKLLFFLFLLLISSPPAFSFRNSSFANAQGKVVGRIETWWCDLFLF